MVNGLTENWRLEAVAVWALNTMRNFNEYFSKLTNSMEQSASWEAKMYILVNAAKH